VLCHPSFNKVAAKPPSILKTIVQPRPRIVATRIPPQDRD
jgi:hypothetical protein